MLAVLAPRYWGAHLLALVLMAAAAGLGWWQYDSYQARRAAEAVDLTRAEPLALTSVMGPDDVGLYIDGIHPSSEGYRFLAAGWAREVAPKLGLS